MLFFSENLILCRCATQYRENNKHFRIENSEKQYISIESNHLPIFEKAAAGVANNALDFVPIKTIKY